MNIVYEARDLAEAELVKGLLEAEEIPAVVQAGALGGVLGELSSSAETLPTVLVNDADLDHAIEIVDQFRRSRLAATPPGENWTCPRCGEVLEGQFSSCWKCGTERPQTE